MLLRKLSTLLWRSINAWIDHRASSMGAAIAYYTALSLAPLLLIVVAVASLVFGREAAQGAIVAELESMIGADGTHMVQAILSSSKGIGGGILSIAIGSSVLIVGATTVFAELQADLDQIWEVPARQRSGVLKFLRSRLLSFGLVLGVGFLLIVSLIASAAISAVAHLWGGWFGGQQMMLMVINFCVSVAFITVLFALIFKYLPTAAVAWKDVWAGAAFTSILFSVGKSLIGLYLGHSALSSSFGAAGAFVVVIVWIYYAAQIFLLGAEFTFQYAALTRSKASIPAGRVQMTS